MALEGVMHTCGRVKLSVWRSGLGRAKFGE